MEPTKSSEMIISDGPGITFGRKFSKQRIITFVMLAVSITVLIVGIVLIAVAASEDSTSTTTPSLSSGCDFSEEAKRVGLDEFLNRVKATYYKLHPYKRHLDPDASTERIKEEYIAYDPTPSVIKKRTDDALVLLKETNEKNINTDALKHRERKALAQVKHFLQHVFGQPYDVNYYAGDWMLGPNQRCMQEICNHGYAVYNGLGGHFKPYSVEDVELIESKLKTHNTSIRQYIQNMKMGVSKGMVRSEEVCKAGGVTISKRYFNVSLSSSTGVLKEWFVQPLLDPDFYSGITENTDNEWKKKHGGKNVSETIKDYLVMYLGEPLNKLLRYIKEEHIRYCVPSNVSSGLANLPLKYVWFDGKENKSWPTDPYLPTGEPLNGSWAYSQIMSYFTTKSMSPMEVQEHGKKQLGILYPMVVDVAKEVTGEKDNETAITKFRKRLNESSTIYFNKEPIPEIESNGTAHTRCSDINGAKKYCPNRWTAFQLWMAESRKVMSMLAPKTIPMFHFTGDKATTPSCPIEMHPNLNPAISYQSYESSDANCSKSAKYKLPFFKKNLGPKYEEWSVNVHEGRPGHHTQVQGYIEHFSDNCGGVIGWLDGVSHNTAFKEGWAYYAEYSLIGQDTDTYDNEPMQRYGMLKWQVISALRLIIDPGLHYFGNITRKTVLEYLSNYAWDDTDMAQKEATRYQGNFGRPIAYKIGQLEIARLKKYCEKELGDKFNLKDFHYQILSQGTCPLAYLSDHVGRYVACVKGKANEGCDVILNPPKKTEAK